MNGTATLADPGLARPEDDGDAADRLEVRLDVHDASRLEWSVAVPLPRKTALAYEINVEMDIPSNAFASHKPWDQLQILTRLDGGALRLDDAVTIDSLRRGAVALTGSLARTGDAFARRCLGAASLAALRPDAVLESALIGLLETALTTVDEGRASLVSPRPGDAAELGRERLLVDEFVSVRLIDLLAGAERALAVLRESRAPHAAQYETAVARLEAMVADALEAETAHRAAHDFVMPSPSSPEALDRYIERAGRLKKHFQEVLFLEPHVYQVAERLHHWLAGLGALIASAWAFAWQMALVDGRSSGTKAASGIFALAVVVGIIYATKDRVKEIGRDWLRGNVHRFYAQRVARYRAPARRFPGRDVIVTARESFEQRVQHLPDPLNPESGATLPSTLIRYTHRGSVVPLRAAPGSDVRRVKHVFRYDFTPLFARLDDAVKQIPVLDPERRRVCFAAAPRSYRFPVEIRVRCAGDEWRERAIVVLHKGGLDRLERETQSRGALGAPVLARAAESVGVSRP